MRESIFPFSELHPKQAGHLVCEEGDQRHRRARLRHQEDSFQDGGRRRAEVPEAEVVSVFRRDHVDTLHGFVVGVRSGTVLTRVDVKRLFRTLFLELQNGHETSERHNI